MRENHPLRSVVYPPYPLLTCYLSRSTLPFFRARRSGCTRGRGFRDSTTRASQSPDSTCSHTAGRRRALRPLSALSLVSRKRQPPSALRVPPAQHRNRPAAHARRRRLFFALCRAREVSTSTASASTISAATSGSFQRRLRRCACPSSLLSRLRAARATDHRETFTLRLRFVVLRSLSPCRARSHSGPQPKPPHLSRSSRSGAPSAGASLF